MICFINPRRVRNLIETYTYNKCELTLSTLDDFGNVVNEIMTFEDTSGPINLVDDVEIFSKIDEFGRTVLDATLVVEEN